MTNAQLYHSLIENRVHTFEPDRRGQDFYCRNCSLPASAEIHNDAAQNSQLPVQGDKRQTVECRLCGVQTVGSIGPASGYLRPICSDCAAQEDGAVFANAVAQARNVVEPVDLPVMTTKEIQ